MKLTGQRQERCFQCQGGVQRFVGREGEEGEGLGGAWLEVGVVGGGGEAAPTTVPRCRNSLPCCASPACCPQSRNCQTASRKGAESSRALGGSRGERRTDNQRGFVVDDDDDDDGDFVNVKSTPLIHYIVPVVTQLGFFFSTQCFPQCNTKTSRQ